MTQSAYDLSEVPALLRLLTRDVFDAQRCLPSDARVPERLLEPALFGPLREAASRPGREFRGRLLELAWRLSGGEQPVPEQLAGCVEALHLGSLVVDDIEDGSARRRGGEALHRSFGVPIALNAGNWLYFYPGGVLLPQLGLAPRVELALRQALDRAVLRCHYGQALDLSVRVTQLRQREVPEVVHATTRLKTGSLMELAAELGGLAAGGSAEQVEVLRGLGCAVGVALQMLDDLTGITSERRCHKGHEDLIGARPTWVWAWLSRRADHVTYLRLRSLLEAVAGRDVHPEVLAMQLREHVADWGRSVVRERLRGALDQARRVFDDARGLSVLEAELERLERYDG